ncbi:MAG TPA: hypothetical protein VH165_09430 [Kofleriaceae bacterium]|jgi:hypothetical protein|nr:hypothetical protein [Kofleriaceae bacterium]
MPLAAATLAAVVASLGDLEDGVRAAALDALGHGMADGTGGAVRDRRRCHARDGR